MIERGTKHSKYLEGRELAMNHREFPQHKTEHKHEERDPDARKERDAVGGCESRPGC